MTSMNKENIIFIFLSIFILLTTVFSFTYAFFTVNVTSNTIMNVSVGVSDAATPIFTAVPNGNLGVVVSGFDMIQGDANNTTATVSSTQTFDVTMIGGSAERQASCTFNFIWNETSSTAYTPSSGRGSAKELTLKMVNSSNTTIMNEANIDTITNGSSIAGDLTITSNGTLTTQTYTITLAFYNLDLSQNSQKNKQYSGVVSVGNVNCGVERYHPTGYWFPTQKGTDYVHPETGGTLQTSGAATGHNVYIGQNSRKYFTCATIQGHEACLSQPYTQYGLEGHTLNTNFTSAQQASAKQALYQVFTEAGISLNLNDNCTQNGTNVFCEINIENVGYIRLQINYDGDLESVDYTLHEYCFTGINNEAACGDVHG